MMMDFIAYYGHSRGQFDTLGAALTWIREFNVARHWFVIRDLDGVIIAQKRADDDASRGNPQRGGYRERKG